MLSSDAIWSNDNTRQLAEVLTAVDSLPTMQKFLRDVLTEKELLEIGARLEAARMLKQGKKYTEIIKKTKLSSRTVARISEWMQNGKGGYEAALTIAAVHHDHIPPVRAE